jgi:hypothetical protein
MILAVEIHVIENLTIERSIPCSRGVVREGGIEGLGGSGRPAVTRAGGPSQPTGVGDDPRQ